MRPRVPIPTGVTKSIIRVSMTSGAVSKLNFSIGLIAVRFSKRIVLVYSAGFMPFTSNTSFNCGLFPRCGACVRHFTKLPSRRKFLLIVSGVTKTSVGLGAKCASGDRKKPKPFSAISK